MIERLPTKFASAERATEEQVFTDYKIIKEKNYIEKLYSTIPNFILILNKERQVVFCNFSALNFLEINETDKILGERPGEVINCIHSHVEKYGCGTSEFCSACGALKAILESQTGKQSMQECRILVNKKDRIEALDLRVYATPFEINEVLYSVFHFVDISDEKRRRMLERIFFHDISNTAGNVYGLTELLPKLDNKQERERYYNSLKNTAVKLIEEIKEQKELLSAERNQLVTKSLEISSLNFLRKVIEEYSHKNYNSAILIDGNSTDISFKTDPVILKRVLGNLIKNALEASPANGMVIIGCYKKDDRVVFWVNNSEYIQKNIQLQIFQRSFSTKGDDRGLGTYSAKLFVERYLNGYINFETDKVTGTNFFVDLPV